MPTYDYECPKCGWKGEKLHGMTAQPGPCPKCGECGLVKRYISTPHVIHSPEEKKILWSTADKKKENREWIAEREEENQAYKRSGH